MTRSTTTIEVVGDGTATGAADASPGLPRPHGITRARQDQVYYVTGLASSALYEADHLVKNIQDAACAYKATRDDSTPAGPLDMTHVLAVIGEALDCIDLASEHLSALSTDIRLRQGDDGP